ncbi:MAG: L-threonylcarbamoyladenylate synthase [Polyangiaceae bacterium]
MKAPVLRAIDPRSPDASLLDEAASRLRRGELVAFPTETVYGLGGLATDVRSLARIFAAKGRPVTHPLIAHVEGFDGLLRLARDVPASARAFADAFWPGGLTLVVPKASSVPPELTGGTDSVAVRVPSHPVALAFVRSVGAPVAAPSANRYQGISPTTAVHVVRSLGDRVDFVLDAGPTTSGIESTVLDLTREVPTILRPGAIAISELRRIDARVVALATVVDESEARVSPGMDAKHYAPDAHVVVVTSRLESLALARDESGRRKVALLLRGAPPVDGERDGLDGALVRALPDDPSDYARGLYAALHDFESAGVAVVVVEAVPSDEAWWAVRDRLTRASSSR